MSIIGTQEEKYYVKELISINELIEKFNNIFEIQRGNIKTLAPKLVDLQEEFKPKYLNFINIKRFAIPIIGRISSGKSTFLNFLLGLKNILETNTNIATKFVCIIRFNQLINKPKAYSVILEERKEKNSNIDNGISNEFPKFNFEKGEELIGDIQKIISDRNKLISEKNNLELQREDFFMIIETNFQIFNKEMLKYSEIFEFMDLPGLNEQDGENNFFRKNILPIVASNTKFAIFIFDCLSIKDKDTIEIYEKFEELLEEKIENSFYILNKIDKATNKKEIEIENFKNYIHERYNVDINKNHFLGTNSLLLLKESEKYNNFYSYLIYKITESNDGNNESFIAYIKKEIEKDLSLKSIQLKDYEIPPINGSEEKLNEIIKELNEQLNNKNFGKLLDQENYLKLEDIFNKNNIKGKNNLEIGKEIYDKLFSSIKNVTESFMSLSLYDKQLHELMNKISQNNSNDDFYEIIEKIKLMNDFHYSTEQLNNLKNITDRLGELEPNNNFIQKIIQSYNDLIGFINKDRKIRIAVLGLYSSGKSTILNCIIGQDILPTSSSECTRRGIIIRYHNKDEPELYKTKFIEKLDYYTFEDSDSPLCSGFKAVSKTLNEYNNINCSFEDSFLILKIKIKFFEDYNINNELKEKIELIDFPGLNTENNFYEEKIFIPLMKFTDGYIFLNKDDLIKEKSNVTILKEIINRIESRKFKFDFNSFLFALNQHSDKELNIKRAQKDLNEIVLNKTYEKSSFWSFFNWKKKEKINEELHVTYLNAKFYEQFLNFRKEFNNFESFIEKTIENMKEEEEENLYKYINDNFYSKYKDTKLHSTDHQTNVLYECLLKILDKNKLNKDKKTCLLICNTYQTMINNFEKHEKYIKSNAQKFFSYLYTQINYAKMNLDENFKAIYKNYIKNLVYSFELINLNLLGNNICREINIENFKNQIQKIYEKYHRIILNKEEENKKSSLEKIEKYINNIDIFDDPQKEGKNVAENIAKINDDYLKDIKNIIEEFKKELEKIKTNLTENIKINNNSLNFNDSVYKNFFSKKHLISHVGVAAAEGIGIAGLIYAGAAFTGPVGWGIAIGIHAIMSLGFLLYDNSKKIDSLKNNMLELKKNLMIKFDGNKDKIESIILNMKKKIDNDIESIVDSQNTEFNGIKSHKSEYEKIYSDFKNLYISKINLN